MTVQAQVAVIGGGPAGLMAAEVLAAGGARVDLFDAMPSVGRKFLLAGIGGMNITHAEPFDAFVSRFRSTDGTPPLLPMLEAFGPGELRAWVHALGVETFVGSSGRVFPKEMKAAPLLRRWLHRLRESGVSIHTRHRWRGWNKANELVFQTADGQRAFAADATVLALGGASWPRLGSDAAWVPWLEARGVTVETLLPANCGFDVAWSEYFRTRHAGAPVKAVALSFTDAAGRVDARRGEFVVSEHGIEGSLVYALAAPLRDAILRDGEAKIAVDLAPDRDLAALRDALAKPRRGRSVSEHLRRQLRLQGVKAALLREGGFNAFDDADALSRRIKSLPLALLRPRPLAEAISTAGGVSFDSLDAGLMLRELPGVFVAGEMMDWEAPTGGYLLTACFATGRAAACGALHWLGRR